MNDLVVSYAMRGSAAWITLDRPAELNALSGPMIDEIGLALDRAEADGAVRCVVFTGAGRAFCAGADLKFVHAMPAEQRTVATAEFLARATALMSRIESLPKPVIAAVNGVATAGGTELLLCCDLIIAADNARIGDGHANYGLLPGAGASVRLPRRIGLSHAKYLFFTGDLMPVTHRIFAQFVTDVVPAERLVEAVDRVADKIASKSPIGLRHMKMLADRSLDLSLVDALRAEARSNIDYIATDDRNEGLTAFIERRLPVFQGR
ncbi:enoyl-CoA hydratase/isomerase family protein [Sphingomonas sp. CROZ-RG-20F-R02-07]|uniref:enoyl-CoA hydratase/isomerase family protein n=1 Tax=Sphingomonas sp. CROZ-RG-20F-R02-07 TaxID=2914832 RepID=UPI001F57962C|nr:enoyl-CoA hydratase/isomerase family protein [Sphingomonas sp. CROZ-RG-20F-R02-07]